MFSSTRCVSSGRSCYLPCRGRGVDAELVGVTARRRTTRTTKTESRRTRHRISTAENVFGRISRRQLVTWVAVALLACTGLYSIARFTPIFAVSSIDVVGGTTATRAAVSAALEGEKGRSLLAVSGGDLMSRLADVPDVLSIRFDRRFPSTLRVTVVPERPVLVLHAGKTAWLVSARARVLGQLLHPRRSSLPKAWVPAKTSVTVGSTLPLNAGGLAAQALAPVAGSGLNAHVRVVDATKENLDFRLSNGLEVRFGDTGDLRLKLAIAGRILRMIGMKSGDSYIDVSVPERPVVGGPNSQVAGGG
ncbi:MAG: FtsQ-type POTRA domain-containing protein [Actinobacteria bacterium]|nr:FtsQ-type POTRA domain-containing protein [Actinomycetota bacterium]